MAIKIYLEKIFDKIEWHFLRNMVHSINLPEKLIKIILSCLSTSKLAILVNGQPADYFQPSRGVRQGDPLPPYIFILGIEFLSILIHNQVTQGLWTPIQITSNGPSISHRRFVDDVFLFSEAAPQNASNISNVLEDFTHHSGLHINYKK